MSPPFFLCHDIVAGEIARLTGGEGRHAAGVARIRVGEEIVLVDGAGLRARAEVIAVPARDEVRARVLDIARDRAPRPAITVVQAIPKSDRAALAVDLAVQGGADRIVPWSASRCVAEWRGPKAEKGRQRWAAVALAAAKQSRRSRIPEITPVESTEAVARRIARAPRALVLHEGAECSIAGVGLDVDEVVVVVGPEGGISPDELEALCAAGGLPVLLGPEVLRTASAALAACAAIGVRTERWSRW